MEKARPGERYILGGENLTLKQILDKLAAITGLPSPKIEAALRGGLCDRRGGHAGHRQDAEARAAGDAGRGAHGPQEDVRHQRQGGARVGMESGPVDDALRRAVEWFRANGYVVSRSRLSRRCAAELAPLLAERSARRVDGVELFELPEALVAIGGIGESCAASRRRSGDREAQPELLVSAGMAGAMSPKLKVGRCWAERERWWMLPPASAIGHRRRGGAGDVLCGWPVMQGKAATGGELRGIEWWTWKAPRWRKSRRQHGIRFAAVKAISDELDFAMPPLNRFVTPQGKFRDRQLSARMSRFGRSGGCHGSPEQE